MSFLFDQKDRKKLIRNTLMKSTSWVVQCCFICALRYLCPHKQLVMNAKKYRNSTPTSSLTKEFSDFTSFQSTAGDHNNDFDRNWTPAMRIKDSSSSKCFSSNSFAFIEIDTKPHWTSSVELFFVCWWFVDWSLSKSNAERVCWGLRWGFVRSLRLARWPLGWKEDDERLFTRFESL